MPLEKKIQQALAISIGADVRAVYTVPKPYRLTKDKVYRVEKVRSHPDYKNPNMVFFTIKDDAGNLREVPYCEFKIQ